MTPRQTGTKSAAGKPEVAIANVRVRYAFRAATSHGGCQRGTYLRHRQYAQYAVQQYAALLAGRPVEGDGRERSRSMPARTESFVTRACPALRGPCPFTRVESDEFSRAGGHRRLGAELGRHGHLSGRSRGVADDGQRSGAALLPGDLRPFHELHASPRRAGTEHRSRSQRRADRVSARARSSGSRGPRAVSTPVRTAPACTAAS